jgi:Zn-dependent peptidase ImmA (M78 family)
MIMDATAIRQTLSKALLHLNPNSTWPVNLHGILPRLGIGLRYEEKKGKAESHLQIGPTPTIVVYRHNASLLLSAKERFSIAHELAHWVVWRRFGVLPCAETYWDHETLCNEFAAELLMPTRALHQFLDRLYKERINPIYFPERVKKSASVSWDAAAKKITAASPADLAYLQLVEVPPEDSPKAASSEPPTIFKVKCSTLTNKPGSFVGQHALLRAQHELLTWIGNLPRRSFKSREIALTSGNLHLTNVRCTFLRETTHWVIHFRPSSEGVRIETSYQAPQTSKVKVATAIF